jgi:HlyD family secretion protein
MTAPAIPDRWKPIRRLNLLGLAVILVFMGGVGGWATTVQLSGAVIAPGVIVVESNLKKVQHPTGGIVSEILVKQGSVVKEGQVVMRLDDTVPRATLGVVRSQLDELTARQARLLAERDGADSIEFDEALTSRNKERSVAAALAGEQKLFEARRTVRNGQRSQLQERIVQINEEIRGLTAQREAKESELQLIAQELKGVAELYAKNLVSISRFMVLQRDQARIQGERGQLIADTARARGRVSETELQILQLDQEFRNDVLKELRDIEGKIAELRERFTAAEDQLKRVDIRAPEAGVVHQLAVHTVGGVIANGETIMMIVPQTDKLVVESKVMPQDIDQIAVKAHVLVRIMAGNQRTNPDVTGLVANISADLTRDPPSGANPGAAYYLVRIELDQESVQRLHGLHLVPGMPAEAFIQTTYRTPLEYFLKPLAEQIARAFRER